MCEEIILGGEVIVPADHGDPSGTYVREDIVKAKDAEIAALRAEIERLEADNVRIQKQASTWKTRTYALQTRVAELEDSDAWRQQATKALEQGTCPVCFATDEAGHTEWCPWGRDETRVAELESTLSDLHDQLYEASMMVTGDHHKMLSAIVSERDEGRARIAELDGVSSQEFEERRELGKRTKEAERALDEMQAVVEAARDMRADRLASEMLVAALEALDGKA